jgi:hypothetical protein
MMMLRRVAHRFRTIPGQTVLVFIGFFVAGVLITLWGILTNNKGQMILGPLGALVAALILSRALPALIKTDLADRDSSRGGDAPES